MKHIARLIYPYVAVIWLLVAIALLIVLVAN